MRQSLSALALGLLFGLGLTVSQMVNPAKVLAFLDVAGAWDPTLLFVLGGAVVVTTVGYRVVLRRPGTLFGGAFQLPSKVKIDTKLLGGAAVFGVGWGLAGLCPGPALTVLGTGAPEAVVFFAAMIAGIAVFRIGGSLFRPRGDLVADG